MLNGITTNYVIWTCTDLFWSFNYSKLSNTKCHHSPILTLMGGATMSYHQVCLTGITNIPTHIHIT